jgi:hypothetical protein
MIEIYNETVRDLFNPTNPLNQGGGLKVREHPKTGPYVEGLELCLCRSYDDVHGLMEEGAKMRTIAKTNMNDTSSRAHTVFQIIFTQSRITMSNDGQTTMSEKVSKINLIDLAGSERVSKTGATGQRLKEGSSINVSLTTLGNVINKLAEKCGDERKKVFVPYRDSQLTWLLKESLGGNAKTIMIAAISPSEDNFMESLSTLRYASRAKTITNRAVINEDPNVRVIKELRDEIERLKQLLLQKPTTAHAKQQSVQEIATDVNENNKLMDQLESSQRIIQQLQMSNEEKEKRTLEIQKARQKALVDAGLSVTEMGELVGVDAKKTPHFVNLNEDPMMTGCLVYFFKDGETRIGRDKTNTITLNGLHIKPEHCSIVHEFGRVTICALSDAVVYVNGKQIEGVIEMFSSDRVILGSNHVFRFSNPLKPSSALVEVDWNYAQNELHEEQQRLLKLALTQKEKELVDSWEEKKKQLEEEFELERQRQEKVINEEREKLEIEKKKIDSEKEAVDSKKRKKSGTWKSKFFKAVTGMQAKFKNKKEETEKEQQKEMAQQRRLDEQLIRMLPLIKDGNDMANEMNKKVKYDLKIVIKNNQPLLNIQVLDRLKNPPKVSLWQPDEFENRLVKIRERYRIWQQDQENYQEVHETRDPFYDSYINLVGTVRVSLKPLAMKEVQEQHAEILDSDGEPQGFLHVALEPCSADMRERPPPVKNSDELLGTSLHFIIKIAGLRNMAKPISNNTFIRFRFYTENYVSTNYASGKNPSFNFKRKYHIKNVTEDLINYLEDSEIVFEIFGEQKSEDALLSSTATSAVSPPPTTSPLSPTSPSSPGPSATQPNNGTGSSNGNGTTTTTNTPTATPTTTTTTNTVTNKSNGGIQLHSQNEKLANENEELKRRLNEANIRHFRSLVKNVSKENILKGDVRQLPLRAFSGISVHIIETDKLPTVDVLGKGDPFVKVQIGDHLKKKTSVKSGCAQPVWDEVLSFKFFDKPTEEDIMTITVLDFDKYFKNDIIGMAEITFGELLEIFRAHGSEAIWLELEGKKLTRKTRIKLSFSFDM